ncbi:hypothetical protein ACHAXS_008645 [Conticribra weissflogii]
MSNLSNHSYGNMQPSIPIDNDDDSDDEIPILADLDVVDSKATPAGTKDPSNLQPVPVTILTGFLGSGKTTLVRNILTSHKHNKRIAVIENEFGGGETNAQLAQRLNLTLNDLSTLSVETMIAKDGTNHDINTERSNLADFIELSNGCVCCTVKDSLVTTLESLLEKRSDLDYVVIEASGMADPGPVASIFWLDEELGSRIRLDGIVTCVDAFNILGQLESTSSSKKSTESGGGDENVGEEQSMEEGDEAARQIAFADRILVNKIDLVESQNSKNDRRRVITMDAVLETIKSINPTAPIVQTTYSKVEDINWILDTKCFDSSRIKNVEEAFEQSTLNASSANNLNEASKEMCQNPACNGKHSPNNTSCGRCDESPRNAITSSLSNVNRQHQHTSAVGTIALFGIGSVDLQKMNAWLASILWPDQDELDKVLRARLEESLRNSNDDATLSLKTKSETKPCEPKSKQQQIYRAKGILSVAHPLTPDGTKVRETSNDWVDDGLACGDVEPYNGLDRRRYILQAVNDLWEVLPASGNLCWEGNETRCCKIVVIGKWLNYDELQKGFNECFV